MLNRATGMVGEQVRLREITRQIVDRERPLGSLIAETGALGSLLEKHAEFRMEPVRDIASGETLTGAGLAISPTQAAMCLREPVRTAAFIRGGNHLPLWWGWG